MPMLVLQSNKYCTIACAPRRQHLFMTTSFLGRVALTCSELTVKVKPALACLHAQLSVLAFPNIPN
jgi:hypothetical protein